MDLDNMDLPDSIREALKETDIPDADYRALPEDLEDKVLDKEEKGDIIEAQDPQIDHATEKGQDSEQGSSFDEYLNTLSSSERELATYAISIGWDPVKAKEPGGKPANVWVATEPYIKALKESHLEIKSLRKAVNNLSKKDVRNLTYTKTKTEEVINQIKDRLAEADKNEDYVAAKEAYTDLKKAEEIYAEAEAQLETVSVPEEPVENTNIFAGATPEYLSKVQSAMWDFAQRNKEWIDKDYSPEFSEVKLERAKSLEKEIYQKTPGIDPGLLYLRVQLALDKEFDSKTKGVDTSKSGQVRKPAIESVSSVRSADHRVATKEASEGTNLVIQALREMALEEPGRARLLPSVNEFKKSRGLK